PERTLFPYTTLFRSSVSLLRSASAAEVIEGMDRILRRYGGVGAIERADQASNWFLMNEIEQLRTLSKTLPSVFLVVAASLTNMVLARLIAVERSEIGLLKAFGYTRREMAMHYVRFVLVIGALGVLLGWIAGYWLGRYYTQVFADCFKFPSRRDAVHHRRRGRTRRGVGGRAALGAQGCDLGAGRGDAAARAAAVPAHEAVAAGLGREARATYSHRSASGRALAGALADHLR